MSSWCVTVGMYDQSLLKDSVWEKIAPLLPPPSRMGRPRRDDRLTLEGALWVLKTGARWRDLPEKYPSGVTCWRRVRDWYDQGVWEQIWRRFLGELDAAGVLDWEQCFIDATFFAAKKGGSAWAKLSEEKARSAWWWSTAIASR